jgi:hypothetical protein
MLFARSESPRCSICFICYHNAVCSISESSRCSICFIYYHHAVCSISESPSCSIVTGALNASADAQRFATLLPVVVYPPAALSRGLNLVATASFASRSAFDSDLWIVVGCLLGHVCIYTGNPVSSVCVCGCIWVPDADLWVVLRCLSGHLCIYAGTPQLTVWISGRSGVVPITRKSQSSSFALCAQCCW